MKNSTSIDFANGQVGNIVFETVSKDKWQDDSLTMTVRKPGKVGQTDEIQCSISFRELKAAVEIIERCVNSSKNQIGYATSVQSGDFDKQQYKPTSVFDLQRELYSTGLEAMKQHDAMLMNGNSGTASSTESAYSADDRDVKEEISVLEEMITAEASQFPEFNSLQEAWVKMGDK